jgi:hypothetical protein
LKRWIIAVLIVLLVAANTPAIAAPSSWALGEIEAAIAEGLVPENLQSRWQDNITRVDFCNLIISLLTKRGYNFNKNDGWKLEQFADTNNENVKKVKFLGIIEGKKTDASGAYFCPDDPLTRQEGAKMIYSITKIGQPSVISPASNEQLIPHVFDDRNYPPQIVENAMEYSYIAPMARTGIDFCYNSGILTDTGGNCFDPNSTFTREQSCIAMFRMNQWADNGGIFSKASDTRFIYYDAATGFYGYKDAAGNAVTKAWYTSINGALPNEFTYGYVAVKQGSSLSILDINGEKVALNNKWNGVFDNVTILSGSRASVNTDNWKTGAIISLPDGRVIAENSIVSDKCRNGWYKYWKLPEQPPTRPNPFESAHLGYLDGDGNVVIQAQYAKAGDFYDGVAIVFDEGKTNPYLIDKAGTVVSLSCGIDFSKYLFGGFAWGKYIVVQDGNTLKNGVMTFEGSSILPCEKINIEMTRDGHFIAGSDTGSGGGFLYDINGTCKSAEFNQFTYDELCYGRYALIFNSDDGAYRLSNENGSIINETPMSNCAGGPAGDGGSTILYSTYIDPPGNETGLAIPEGNWVIVMDDTGKELWRTVGMKRAEFINGTVRIERIDSTIEYYTPNGIKLC